MEAPRAAIVEPRAAKLEICDAPAPSRDALGIPRDALGRPRAAEGMARAETSAICDARGEESGSRHMQCGALLVAREALGSLRAALEANSVTPRRARAALGARRAALGARRAAIGTPRAALATSGEALGGRAPRSPSEAPPSERREAASRHVGRRRVGGAGDPPGPRQSRRIGAYRLLLPAPGPEWPRAREAERDRRKADLQTLSTQ